MTNVVPVLIDIKESAEDCISIISNTTIENKGDILTTRLESILVVLEDIYNYMNLEVFEDLKNCFNECLTKIQESNGASEVIQRQIGRPKLLIPISQLEYLLSMNFKIAEIARIFGVHKNTIINHMKESGLSVKNTYSTMSDDELSTVMTSYLLNYPNTGIRRMKGYLFSSGIRITERRVRDLMRYVDPDGVYQRRQKKNKTIKRREYYVPYSNQMWHIDANIKLIRWGFVIRSGIDGKSRIITYLKVSNNNRADSHLLQFMDAVKEYGVPYRVRTDKGGENVLIAKFMLENRGLGRRSHICGRSVHNQRIERFWRDVSEGCTHFYRSVFYKLESEGALDIDNPLHLDTLHKVFLPRINQHLQKFREGWNLHPISTENNKSPTQLFLMHLPPPEYDLEIQEDDLENVFFTCNTLDDLEQFHESRQDNITNPEPFSSDDDILPIDPLSQSTDYGCDIYIRLLNYRLSNNN